MTNFKTKHLHKFFDSHDKAVEEENTLKKMIKVDVDLVYDAHLTIERKEQNQKRREMVAYCHDLDKNAKFIGAEKSDTYESSVRVKGKFSRTNRFTKKKVPTKVEQSSKRKQPSLGETGIENHQNTSLSRCYITQHNNIHVAPHTNHYANPQNDIQVYDENISERDAKKTGMSAQDFTLYFLTGRQPKSKTKKNKSSLKKNETSLGQELTSQDYWYPIKTEPVTLKRTIEDTVEISNEQDHTDQKSFNQGRDAALKLLEAVNELENPCKFPSKVSHVNVNNKKNVLKNNANKPKPGPSFLQKSSNMHSNMNNNIRLNNADLPITDRMNTTSIQGNNNNTPGLGYPKSKKPKTHLEVDLTQSELNILKMKLTNCTSFDEGKRQDGDNECGNGPMCCFSHGMRHRFVFL